MIPFRFGSPEASLFAVYHPPAPATGHSMAVLLCNPFGQEAVRLHRFYKVLAERLARSGMAVLRFDYFGTGESEGDDLTGRLDLWSDNVLAAHRELRQRSGCHRVAWIGARLGATVAHQAATRLSGSLDQLILWEPVLDGKAYLAQLALDHARSVARGGLSLPPASELPSGEALGFAMSSDLIEDIAQVTPRLLTRATPVRTTSVLGQPDDIELAAAVQRAQATQPSLRHQTLQVPFDWTSEEALNTSLVPPAALQALSKLLEDARS